MSFAVGFTLCGIGAYLVDSAVQGRHPVETLADIIRDPANAGAILASNKGALNSVGAVSSSVGANAGTAPTVKGANNGPGSGIAAPPPSSVPKALDLVTIKTKGGNVTVARSAAKQFKGFINALVDEGYKITSLGGYADRPIAGTNKPSLHSLGRAIDINPSQNPVSYGATITNLPSNVESLAAKYGLVWGGSSKWNKEDAMHFSIPTEGYSY